MIVACQSRSSLKACFDTLEGSSRDEYKVFKAECKNPCYDEVRSFYGLYVTNEKVTVSVDYVTVEDLLDRFPYTDIAVINKVMAQQVTMTSSCDVLSSLVSSHGTVLFNNADFFTGNYDWPSVQESIRRSISLDVTSLCDNWSILELDNFDHLHLSPDSKADRIENSDGTVNAPIEDWEILRSHSGYDDCCFSPTVTADRLPVDVEIPFNTKLLNGNNLPNTYGCDSIQEHKITYKEKLLIPAKFNAKKVLADLEVKQRFSQMPKWTPRFEIVKSSRNRVDRQYGRHEFISNLLLQTYEDERFDDYITNEMEMFIPARD